MAVRKGAERCDVRTVHPERVAAVRELLLDDAVFAELAELFGALADSSRAKVVYCLLQQELCVCDLAAAIGLSESAVSQHLRVLRSLRVAKSRREGKVVYYSLDDAHVTLLVQVGLTHLGHADTARELEALAAAPVAR